MRGHNAACECSPVSIYVCNICLNDDIKDRLLSPRFFKKRRGYCNCVRHSVCPLCYLLLNHWTKFNQIWCVSYSHEWSVQCQLFFCPAPWGPGEGSKGQISFNFNYSQFQRFLYQTLCVFSQMNDTKHIR